MKSASGMFSGMVIGHSYQFRIKRRGTSKLAEYQGRFLAEQGDTLVFANLESAASTIRVHPDMIEGTPVELHMDDEA